RGSPAGGPVDGPPARVTVAVLGESATAMATIENQVFISARRGAGSTPRSRRRCRWYGSWVFSFRDVGRVREKVAQHRRQERARGRREVVGVRDEHEAPAACSGGAFDAPPHRGPVTREPQPPPR